MNGVACCCIGGGNGGIIGKSQSIASVIYYTGIQGQTTAHIDGIVVTSSYRADCIGSCKIKGIGLRKNRWIEIDSAHCLWGGHSVGCGDGSLNSHFKRIGI